MAVRLRCGTRRHARAALLMAASGCLCSGGSGGCARSPALGQGSFSYACPAPDSADPSAPNADAFCAPDAGAGNHGPLPDVAVGASFSLQFDQASTGGPRPAVPSLARSTPQGWALTQPGWLGFIAWSGSDVVDFTHVRGQAIASIRLEPDLTAAPLPVGSVTDVAAAPLGADGVILAGSIACTFTASDASVLSVRSESGRVAHVGAVAAGEATLAASCMGVQTEVTVRVSTSPGAGAGASVGADASADAGAGADAGDDASDAPEGGG